VAVSLENKMATWLKHEQHGFHLATDDEIEKLIKVHGWTLRDEVKPVEVTEVIKPQRGRPKAK